MTTGPSAGINTVMKYDLGRLGRDRFVILLHDLLKAELGLTLPPFKPWSSGGGQLCEFKDRIAWPGNTATHEWLGTTFINVWFLDPQKGSIGQFLGQVKQQLEYWQYAQEAWIEFQKQLESWQKERESWERTHEEVKKAKKAGIELDFSEQRAPERPENAAKPNLPDYMFYIINTDTPQEHLTREMREIFRSHASLGIKGFTVWQNAKLCKILDDQRGLRTIYAGLIASDDVLKDVSPYMSAAPFEFGNVITRHLANDLIADQWVRLNEVGMSTQQKLSLSNVAIDLPLTNKTNAAAYILTLGNENLRPSMLAKSAKPHVVLIGGPGQGKTTIGQLICQVYREALLSQSPRLPREAIELVAGVRETLARIPLNSPENRRWPIRISLTAFADAAIGPRKVSLLRYIAQQVSSRTTESIDPPLMRSWMRAWPWLIVLDGLDEVASQAARETLMLRISQFLTEAAQVDCDLLILATTRPQGYMGEFSAEDYTHCTLSALRPEQAASYAKQLAEVQHVSDPDMRDRVIKRTSFASKDDSTARLMQTPLQVTIMSLILENRERAPQARYALFDAYYDAIYAREEGKPGDTGKLLEQLKSHINALHDRVALLLQVQAEQEGEADTSVSNDELRDLAIERLEYEGFSGPEAQGRANQVIKAVTQRLVLLVPKAIEAVGFEVRSIQEFLAARALVSGPDLAITKRLDILVGSAHWRNTWLFAAGRIFVEREYYRRDLITLLEDIDNVNVVNVVVAPGADLALDLLDDDLAATTPALKRALARHALTLLGCAPDEDLERRANVLYEVANSDSVVRAAADQAIDQALSGSGTQKMTAQVLLAKWQKNEGPLALRCRQLVGMQQVEKRRLEYRDRTVRWREEQSVIVEFDPLLRLDAISDELKLGKQERASVVKFLNEIIDQANVSYPSSYAEEVLSRSVTANAVGRLIVDFSKERPALALLLRSACRNWIKREPVGTKVLKVTPFPDPIK